MIQPFYTSGTTGGNPKTSFLIGRWAFHSQAASTPIPVAGTIRNWHVVLKTAPSPGNTKTLTVYRNNVATALSVTANAGDTDLSDLTHSVTVAAGDLIDVRQSNTGADTAADFESSLEWTPDDGVSSIHGYAGWNPIFDGATTLYDGAFFGGDIGTTEAHEASYVGSAGTVTAHYVNLNAAPGGGKSRTFVIIKNGVVQDGTGGTPNTTVTISDAATTGSASFSLAIAKGDLVSMRETPTGSPASTGGSGAIAFTPTTAGQVPIGMDTLLSNTAQTHYSHLTGSYARFGDWSVTESEKQNIGSDTALYLYGMAVWLDAAPGTGKSRRFTLRLNGEPTAQTVILSGAATSAICSGTAVRVGAGDLVSLEEIVTGTAAGDQAKVTFYLVGESLRGSTVFGVNTTVKATRAIAFGLDGATNVHDTAGEFKVFGDEAVTGDLVVDGTIEGDLADGDRGDISISGGVWTIDNGAVSYAKIQDVSAASKLLGRGSAAGAGDVQEITLGTNLSMTGTTLDAAGGGDVTGQASSVDGEIALFSGTGGKTIKRATGSGYVHAASGVYSAAALTRVIATVIGNGSDVIATGVAGFISVPVTGTITKVRLLSSDAAVTSGSIVIDIWKDTYANYPPADADSITAGDEPTISSDTDSEDSTLSGWTTSVTAGDVLGFNVDSVTSLKRVTVELSIAEL